MPRATPTPDTCEIAHIHPEAVQRVRVTLPDAHTADTLAALFNALGDPTRLRLLSALAAGPLCVCDLAAALGVSQSAVSHQLRLLRALHLVRARRDGKLVWYTLDDDHVRDLLGVGYAHIGHAAPLAVAEPEEVSA